MSEVLEVKLSDDLKSQLKNISHQLKKNEEKIVNEAIKEYIENIKDYDIALKRLNDKNDKIISLEELKDKIGI